MDWNDRKYEQFLIVGWQQPNPLFHWHVWQPLAEILNPLMKSARGRVGVRIQQEYRKTERPVLFGNLGWNEKSHQKWAHQSAESGQASSGWRFLRIEFWNPSAGICEREDVPPDVFLTFLCDEPSVKGQRLTYDLSLHLVVASDLPEVLRLACAPRFIRSVAQSSRAIICAHRVAAWCHHDGGDDLVAPSPMDYIAGRMPLATWANKSPSLSDFPTGALWKPL